MTSTQPTQPGTGWTIENQTEASEVSPANMIVPGFRVYFITQHLVHASVFIPREAYTAERVRQAIIDQAVALDTVHAMQG